MHNRHLRNVQRKKMMRRNEVQREYEKQYRAQLGLLPPTEPVPAPVKPEAK